MQNETKCSCKKGGLTPIYYGQIVLGITLRTLIMAGSLVCAYLFLRDQELVIGIGFLIVIAAIVFYDRFSYARNKAALISAGHNRSCAKQYALAKTYMSYPVI